MPFDLARSLRVLMNALHLLFAALFVLVLGTAVARAACAGEDIRARLEAERPGALAAIEAEAAVVPNATGKLWRVQAPNGAVSHLFGTMHVSDEAAVALSPEAEAAHAEADTVVIETLGILDPAAMGAAMAADPSLMFYTDGSSLLDIVPDEDEALLDDALTERGSSLVAMKAFKPWLLMAQLGLPACAISTPEAGLDSRLATEARDRGDAIDELETPGEQLSAFASIPTDMQVDALIDMARLADGSDDLYATMGALYREGAIGAIWPTLNAAGEMLLGESMSSADEDAMIAVERELVVKRNYTMAERAAKFLDAGDAFIAVGALHLPGEEGLVELLRGDGYTVEMVAL